MAAETPITARTAIAQLLDQFLDWTNENKMPRTLKWYQRQLKSFVQFIGYKLTVNHIKSLSQNRRGGEDV